MDKCTTLIKDFVLKNIKSQPLKNNKQNIKH